MKILRKVKNLKNWSKKDNKLGNTKKIIKRKIERENKGKNQNIIEKYPK